MATAAPDTPRHEDPTPVDRAAESARQLSVIKDPIETVTNSIERLAKAAESSASTFLMGFGAVLILLAVLTQMRFDTYQLSHLRAGEFIALLLSGVIIMLIGGGVRMYLGTIEARTESDYVAWVQERAAKELDVQSERAGLLLDAALKGGNVHKTVNP